MAKCFCGCDRKVGFTDRGMNKQGHRTVELLEKTRAIRAIIEERGPLGEGGDVTGILKSYDKMIAEGEQYESDWADVLHSGGDMPPSQALAFKREWLDWGKRCMNVNSVAGLPEDKLIAVLRLSEEQEREISS